MASLSLIQQQKLQTKLTPSQIQMIRMLELPSVELQQRVNEELQENPALEEGIDPEENAQQAEQDFEDGYAAEEEDYINPLQNEDFDYESYINDDDVPDYAVHQSNGVEEHDDIPVSGGTSFGEYLKSQVYLTKMDKPDRHIAKWVLGNIDDDGYLRRSIEQLVDDLSFQEGLVVSDERMADIVNQIKQFDPPGVASADLQECLITQLKQKKPTKAVQNAIRILTFCFDHFSNKRFNRIKERLRLDDQALQEAENEIRHLNQKPANAFTGNVYESQQTTIIPDFYVENRDGELILTLNTGDIPALHVSREYKEMFQTYVGQRRRNKEMANAVRFIKAKLDSAKWFIDAIHQRNDTLQRTMSAIIAAQHDFFMEGDETFLKPMILQDIADKTGLDVSTISRVSNSKYVQTEFGIFPLKYFFSDSIVNAEGEAISTQEIKTVLQEFISGEDKHNPLNDDQLVEVMTAAGYPIARRTIAKYREQMGIPVARLRRQA